MKAAVITRFGGPEVLEVREAPRPRPGRQEILVRVRSSALNRADLLQRVGRYAAPQGAPENIPGLEFAGEVVELSSDARRWKEGDRVMGIVGGGAHAEFVATHEDAVAAVPLNLDWPAAGAVPEVFITAHDALNQAAFNETLRQAAFARHPAASDAVNPAAFNDARHRAASDAINQAAFSDARHRSASDALNLAASKRGENVLVHAVGSGVGLAAIQLVRALGGHAFGTSRTPDKIERAKEFGLEEGYIVPEPGALKELAAFTQQVTGGRGIDVVLDLNGGPYFSASLETMALRGRIILIGGVAGGKTEVDLYQILGKRLHVIGTVLRARSLDEKIAITNTFAQEVVPLLANESIKPVIDSVFPLEEIQDAHRRLESNETFGKVVLTIS